MHRLIRYIMLPSERSEVEVKHVKRINHIALAVCYLHIPAFLLVAYLCQTSMIQAAVYAAVILAGPTFAYFTIEDPRKLSLVFGFTSMCLGALLVHLGQSSVQIEMHFHFFVFLALLAVYGNPMTVLVAAVTVAIHHLVFYLFLPNSVFNYDAAIWVVGIHALFVVLESVASCFIARSFFDNVIGLEKVVAKRTAELDSRNRSMKLILDHTSQGFLTLHLDGSVEQEMSKPVTDFFGPSEEISAKPIWEVFAGIDAGFAQMLRLGLDGLVDGFMPVEIMLSQMPKTIQVKGQVLGFDYQAIYDGDHLVGVSMVFSNITDQLKRDEVEREQQEILQVFQCINQDRAGFLEFYDEARGLVAEITTPGRTDESLLKRQIHTLKGNAGIFGIISLFDWCHQLETVMQDESRLPEAEELQNLQKLWQQKSEKFLSLMGGHEDAETIEVKETELESLLASVHKGARPSDIAKTLVSWKHEPMEKRLARIGEKAKTIAQKLRKDHLELEIEHNNVRLAAKEWQSFWSALIHAVRNSIDHGLKLNEMLLNEQINQLGLYTAFDHNQLVISISDNGHGIDWDKIRARAHERGLSADSEQELIDVLFADGISSRDTANEYSGRGVGMGALKQECESRGGFIKIESAKDRGTKISFVFPLEQIMATRKIA